jgi:hypothetical protein
MLARVQWLPLSLQVLAEEQLGSRPVERTIRVVMQTHCVRELALC